MKKFFNDNLWWLMIVALVLGGYAAYMIYKSNKEADIVSAE